MVIFMGNFMQQHFKIIDIIWKDNKFQDRLNISGPMEKDPLVVLVKEWNENVTNL